MQSFGEYEDEEEELIDIEFSDQKKTDPKNYEMLSTFIRSDVQEDEEILLRLISLRITKAS